MVAKIKIRTKSGSDIIFYKDIENVISFQSLELYNDLKNSRSSILEIDDPMMSDSLLMLKSEMVINRESIEYWQVDYLWKRPN